jgi:hypothetical protein
MKECFEQVDDLPEKSKTVVSTRHAFDDFDLTGYGASEGTDVRQENWVGEKASVTNWFDA